MKRNQPSEATTMERNRMIIKRVIGEWVVLPSKTDSDVAVYRCGNKVRAEGVADFLNTMTLRRYEQIADFVTGQVNGK